MYLRATVGVVIKLWKNISVFISNNLSGGVDQAVLRNGAVLLNFGSEKQTRGRHQQRVARI